MPTFPSLLPHGDIQEILPEVFFVKGQMEFPTPEAVVLLARAMTIVRQGSDLTLVNTVRLSDEGLTALEKLGNVTNIVRIGASHGRDDAFYSDRYDLPVWAVQGTNHQRPIKAELPLTEQGEGPIKEASMVLFQTTSEPEAVICLHRNGGVLITCDSFQNMVGPDEYIDGPSAKMLEERGFFRRCNIGPAWRARLQPKKSDFERILELDFQHLLPSHGEPLLNEAHGLALQTVNYSYPD